MKKQTVSILCPSFNHERYISGFINSILAQTNPNWELIIVDDCSSDKNVSIVKSYKDSRIKLIQHTWNQGINASFNDAFQNSSGEFIAFCASDDMLCKDYIENVLNTFNNNPEVGILYSDLQFIDENNNFLKGKILRNATGNRFEVLRNLFLCGNCMWSPGMAMRRKAMQKIYPLPFAISQYQDYKINIELLLNFDFKIMDKVSVLYRMPSKKSGISYVNPVTLKMCDLEENILMNTMLQINSVEQIKNIFTTEQLEQFGKLSDVFIPYYLGMIALRYGKSAYKREWGYKTVASFIDKGDNYKKLHQKYGYDFKTYLGMVRYIGVSEWFQKYKKYKKQFNILLVVLIFVLIMMMFFWLI